MSTDVSTRVFLCSYCHKPLDLHTKSPHSIGCPPDQYEYRFSVEGVEISRTTCSHALAVAIARSIAASHNKPCRRERLSSTPV